MKRFFLISFMLLLVGAAYADGPRYRFKSRRALQTLWRKEVKENQNTSDYGYRRMSAKELQGEREENTTRAERVYGVVVEENPFDNNEVGSGNSFQAPVFGGVLPPSTSTTLPGLFDPNGTDYGKRTVIPGSGSSSGDPRVGGYASGSSGQGKDAPPFFPVGDGIPVLLIFTAALIAIKKRLSD